MKPEQTIELAQVAGLTPAQVSIYQEQLQRFAELVGNAKLEEAAKVVERMSNDPKASVAQELALDLASDKIRELKS